MHICPEKLGINPSDQSLHKLLSWKFILHGKGY